MLGSNTQGALPHVDQRSLRVVMPMDRHQISGPSVRRSQRNHRYSYDMGCNVFGCPRRP